MSFRHLAALVALASSGALADASQLSLTRGDIEIGKLKGNTWFKFMTLKPGGGKDALDADGAAKFKIANADRIKTAKGQVDPRVYRKFILGVRGGEAALPQLAARFQQDTTTRTLSDDLGKTGLVSDKYGIAPFLSLASGAGVAIRIDADNVFYNIGYGTGAVLNDEMTGRSFGHGPNHKALDASDAFYLDELEQYLKANPDSSNFYKALLKLLTNCDPSGYAALDGLGKTVATDFMAVYTAEADRHLMSNLKMHPWENDLAEVTFISAYSVQSGLLYLSGKLQPGKLGGWWAKSATSNRSGIGETRHDRRALQSAIVAYERTKHPDLIQRIESLVGRRHDGDVFRALTEHLNNFHTPASLGAKADQIVDAYAALLQEMRKDASDIKAWVDAHPAAQHATQPASHPGSHPAAHPTQR
jgi:hypothetical protein